MTVEMLLVFQVQRVQSWSSFTAVEQGMSRREQRKRLSANRRWYAN